MCYLWVMGEDERLRLLAAMPLHAITATYGEEGLRERFSVEAAALPAAGRRRAAEALELAARLHAADSRQREPYLNHLLRVAIRIICYYGVRDPDVVCAALLHDAVEDHAGDLAAGLPPDAGPRDADAPAGAGQPAGPGAASARQAALGALADRFGRRVAELVAAVTNPEYAPGRDRHEQYREHVAASLAGCPWARVIKASDFTDNGVGLIHSTGATLQRLAGKYAPLVPVLREMIKRPDTPLSAQARSRILGQLDLAEQRFSAIQPRRSPGAA
jgi:HD domain